MAFKRDLKLVIVTGLSGAGKTEAVRSLEDLGYFCVDNLPPNLIPKFAELLAVSDPQLTSIALVMDIRGGHFFGTLLDSLEYLDVEGFGYEILYLEAADETLVRRFKETRRRHPLSREGRILEGILEERKRLQDIRGKASKIIDTTDMTPQQLKEQVQELFGQGISSSLVITVMSFGFKYGLPLDADLVMDVRFLPNPHYEQALRPLTGEDKDVETFVMASEETKNFMDKFNDLLLFLLPFYVREGKSHLVVAIGCTGGRHRSVTLAARVGALLEREGYRVFVKHRDMLKSSQGG